MLQRLLGIHKLKKELTNLILKNHKISEDALKEKLATFDKRITSVTKQFDAFKMEMNQRLSRIEVLFEKELKEKEQIRDELVKAKRLGKKVDVES